ncbi:hypothetical protein FSP39_010342 [Pinctada imbricata]|uniref:L-Fucosyltransferase n=1 Tax=Pinctada imbricata TaxID=66713 RepID=A0AA89BTD7_PINIB|nr:hypothetical protein FSP39_010342 [Pinctada imbricata]
MTPYITSYIRQHKVKSTLNYAESTWISSIAAMGQGMSMFLGGLLNRRIGPRWSTLIGGWLARQEFFSTFLMTKFETTPHVDRDCIRFIRICDYLLIYYSTCNVSNLFGSLGVLLTYFTIKISFVLTVMTYGLLFGLGVGVAYAVPMDCAMRWLPDKKGLINGIVVAGFGSGAFIFDQIQTAYLNPDNLVTDIEVDNSKYFSQDAILDKVPSGFLLLGGCYAAMQFIGSMLLVNPPEKGKSSFQTSSENTSKEDTGPLVYKLSKEEQEEIEDDDDDDDGSFTPRQAVKLKNFIYYGSLTSSTLKEYSSYHPSISLQTFLQAYGQTFIDNDHFLAIVGSFSAVFNGLGRIMWGHLADRFCYKTAMVFSCGLFSALILSFGLTSLAGEGLYFIYVCLLFLCFSGNFSLLPTATAKTFGKKYYPVIYGMVFTASLCKVKKTSDGKLGNFSIEKYFMLKDWNSYPNETYDARTCRFIRRWQDNYDCGYDESVEDLFVGRDVHISGYFQSWKYWIQYETDVRKLFRFRDNIKRTALKNLTDILDKWDINLSKENITLVGIHIRRGDYVEGAHFRKFGYMTAPPEYLHKATSYMRKVYGKCLFLVCSNDMKWSKNVLHTYSDVHFVQGNTAIADMALLTLTNHTIMTVGTFGWWIGFLTSGTTIYYKYPFRPGSDFGKQFPGQSTVDHFYPGWIPMT